MKVDSSECIYVLHILITKMPCNEKSPAKIPTELAGFYVFYSNKGFTSCAFLGEKWFLYNKFTFMI